MSASADKTNELVAIIQHIEALKEQHDALMKTLKEQYDASSARLADAHANLDNKYGELKHIFLSGSDPAAHPAAE
jgi:dynactin complex subunit